MPTLTRSRSGVASKGALMPQTKKKLPSHEFAVVLDGITEPDGRIEDALYEAGCDDAILAFRNRVAYLEFDRMDETFESALLSAIRDVERADHLASVSHVEPDDLVHASEIARRLGCTREYVRLLVDGRRGEGGFPTPLSGVTGTTRLWSWTAVLSWMDGRGRLADATLLSEAKTIRDTNAALAARRESSANRRSRALLRRISGTDPVS
jgi:hypothetical protein